ncbi:MAG: serine/threonine protein kinase [bacterium]|nr:serine/threonine protein kinase [bacterium]
MGNLTEHFSRYEFECECGCGFNTVDWELLDTLEKAHTYFRKEYKTPIKIVITGPNRCQEHNAQTDGASKNSFHIKGKAVDHKVYYRNRNGKWIQVNPNIVYDYYDTTYPDKFGVIKYVNRVHMDVRSRKYRNDKTKRRDI